MKLYEDNVFRRIPWREATCRDQEVRGVKVDELWKFDSSTGGFKKQSDNSVTADLASDLKSGPIKVRSND